MPRFAVYDPRLWPTLETHALLMRFGVEDDSEARSMTALGSVYSPLEAVGGGHLAESSGLSNPFPLWIAPSDQSLCLPPPTAPANLAHHPTGRSCMAIGMIFAAMRPLTTTNSIKRLGPASTVATSVPASVFGEYTADQADEFDQCGYEVLPYYEEVPEDIDQLTPSSHATAKRNFLSVILATHRSSMVNQVILFI